MSVVPWVSLTASTLKLEKDSIRMRLLRKLDGLTVRMTDVGFRVVDVWVVFKKALFILHRTRVRFRVTML